MALLFAGNRVAGQLRTEPPWIGETEAATTLPQEQAEPEITRPRETEARETSAPETQPPVDERKARLAAAAEGMDAAHIFVYDTAADDMLCCTGDAGEDLYPASITKLFTAWLALRYLQPEEVITAGDELSLVQPGSSTAYIRKGCRLTVGMLIEAMLLPSGNDAAYVLAAAAGRAAAGDETLDAKAAVAVFVEAMNREDRDLGFRNTVFQNPDGYHREEHISCPEDVVRMGILALEEPLIAGYAGLQQASVVFESGQWITWYNTNALLNPESPYYSPGCRGLKTGYTGEAGYCLLAAFEKDGGYLLVGIFGGDDKNARYTDVAALLELCQ